MNRIIKQEVAVDIETTDLDPFKGKIKIISIFSQGNGQIYDDIYHIKELLEDKNIKKIFHNAVFDVTWLEHNGIEVKNYSDTLIMAQLLKEPELSLQCLSEKYCDFKLNKDLQNSSNWSGEITDKHKEYCLNDAKATKALYDVLIKKIKQEKLEQVLERELKALPAIIELKLNGISIDFDKWCKEGLKIQEAELKELEDNFKNYLGMNINLNSPKQLIEAFNSRGIKIKSTADEVLADFEEHYPEIRLLRKFRKKNKNIKMFGDKFSIYIDNDNRVRGEWWLIGAETGRMTCKKPAMQAIPNKMKEYFKAESGKIFIIGDYSQIELRVLAEISKDEVLLDAFNKDLDLHSLTAANIFKKSVDRLIDDERKIGKVLNFGMIYGISSYGIKKNVKKLAGMDISIEEAEQYRISFLKTYKQVKLLQNNLLSCKYLLTLGGRRWRGNNGILTKTKKLNYPIQGTAAEGLKEALGILVDKKPKFYKIIAIVHDEIVLEVPERKEREAKDLLNKCMIEGMQKLIKSVPIKVDITSNKSWIK